MTRLLSRRMLQFVALTVLFSAIFSTLDVSVAEARPLNSMDCVYYSDASYTTDVGWTYFDCNGNFTRSGTTSEYRECFSDCCYCHQ